MSATAGVRRPGDRTVGAVLRYGLLLVLAVLFLIPFYVLLRNGFATRAEIAAPRWVLVPAHPDLRNLRELFANPGVAMARSLLNSALVAVASTVATLYLSATAAYGLSRIGGRAARWVLGATVLTLMVPAAVTFVPSFVLVSSLGWISTLRGLIVPTVFSAFATFLFRQFFRSFPKELEEAAAIDGAGYWRTFWGVVMPNAYGVCAAVGTIVFLGSWNAFLWPLLIGQDRDFRTVQVALSTFMNSQRVDLATLFVGALVAIVPVLLVFVFLQRYLVQGVEQSGLD